MSMLLLIIIILAFAIGWVCFKMKRASSHQNKKILPDLDITYMNDDFDAIIRECIEKRDFTGAQNLYIKVCAEYDNSDPLKSYIYRKNQIHCTLMRYYNEQILEMGLDVEKYQVQVLPNHTDEKKCKAGDGYRVDFKEFYKSPMLPCCIDCKCRVPHFCSMIISPTYTDKDILDMV